MITGNKRHWLLWFLFLAAPGSGFLRFDGIPFSSKLEFAVLGFSVTAICIPTLRTAINKWTHARNQLVGQWVTLVLVCTIVVKLFTFVLLPLGDGFEACYRSIYAPLASGKCEKSYEAPFLKNDMINVQGSITRMEPQIDFGSLLDDKTTTLGASVTSWKLPFANDFPRLGTPWLDRLPFTAHFGTVVNVENNSFIPIVYTGEVSVEVNGVVREGISYERQSTLFIPVATGKNIMRITYKFADLDTPEIPDLAPTIRGPWAHLFVGAPTPQNTTSLPLTLKIAGWSIDQTAQSSPKFVYLTTELGEEIAKVATFARPDVANAYQDEQFINSGFIISIPLKNPNVDEATYLLTEKLGDNPFATISVNFTSKPVPSFSYQSNNVDGKITEFDSVTISLGSGTPLKPSPLIQPSIIQYLLLLLLDSSVLLPIIALVVIGLSTLAKHRRELTHAAIGVGATSLLASYTIPAPRLFSNIPVIGRAAFTVYLLIIIFRKKQKYFIASAMIPIFILVSQAIISMNRMNNGMVNASWWNFSLWYSRGSDWFVTQGYARTIFVENSLRGGEGLFYFQPGARYFVFFQHLLFGENDVILQILVAVALLVTIVLITKNLLATVDDAPRKIAITLFCALNFSLFTHSDMILFAIFQASEYPAWIISLLIFGFVIRGEIGFKVSMILVVLCGLLPNFRPNQIFGACCLFLLVLLNVDTKPTRSIWLQKSWMFFAFGFVMSLSLFHNLYYADSFTLFSSSGGLNADFKFIDLLKITSDPLIRDLVFEKMRLALWWNTSETNTVQLTFWAFQLIWLSGVIRATTSRSKRATIWIALSLPLTYLIPLLPYRFESYWPRHIVIIQLALGLSGMYALGNLGPLQLLNKNHKDRFSNS